jgi:ribosomal-protein-alanine N-acetyltransferase
MYKTKKAIWWTFTQRPFSELIGYGGIFEIDKNNNHAEIGYGLLPEFWGKGFVSEAMKAMSDFGLTNLQLHKLYAIVDPNNGASIKVLEKNNFHLEGLLRDHLFARGKYFDMCYYSKIKNDEE